MHIRDAGLKAIHGSAGPLALRGPIRPPRWSTSSTAGFVGELRRRLDHLQPVDPLLCFSQLDRSLEKALRNILARRSSEVVKVTGLGKGVSKHRVTRPDLKAYASAVLVEELSGKIVPWYTRHFDRGLAPNIPAKLLPSASMRAAWSIGRMLLAIYRLKEEAPGTASAGALVEVSTALARLAAPWAAQLDGGLENRPLIHSEEFVARWSVSDWTNSSRQGARTSGSAIAADTQYAHVVEANFRPAVTWTHVGRTIHVWETSSDATARVLASVLCQAGVLIADAGAVRQQALEQAHEHVWAAAALALFPAPDTLERCLADSRLGHTAVARRWSAAQIRAAMEGGEDLYNAEAKKQITLTFDHDTLRDVQRVCVEILGARHLQVAS